MSLCFAGLAPHGWLAVPLLCGEEGGLAAGTQAAMQEMGRRMAAARPDTVVVVTPHGTMVEGCVSLLNTGTVYGDTRNLPWAEGSRHSFRLEFEVDRDLNAAIAGASEARGVPALRVTNQTSFSPLEMDFACLIPLWHTAATLWPRPRVVIACQDRREEPVGWEACVRFGEAVAAAIAESHARIAFIASGDLSHAHDPEHEYGYDPASAEFDGAVQAALESGSLSMLVGYDAGVLARAKTDAFGPLMALHGLLKAFGWGTELLSYEAPMYFGMACATAAPLIA